MKRPTFFEGVGVALGAGVLGSMLLATLPLFLPGVLGLRALIAALGLLYVLYLLGRSPERIGRITTVSLWLAAAGGLWLTAPPLMGYLLAHLGLVWLVRSLYHHAGVLGALVDLGLNGFALAAALWAWTATGSTFITLWCFFLVQALFVAIGTGRKAGRTGGTQRPPGEDSFDQAYRAAETALRRFSTVR